MNSLLLHLVSFIFNPTLYLSEAEKKYLPRNKKEANHNELLLQMNMTLEQANACDLINTTILFYFLFAFPVIEAMKSNVSTSHIIHGQWK